MQQTSVTELLKPLIEYANERGAAVTVYEPTEKEDLIGLTFKYKHYMYCRNVSLLMLCSMHPESLKAFMLRVMDEVDTLIKTVKESEDQAWARRRQELIRSYDLHPLPDEK